MYAEVKRRKEIETGPTADLFRSLGYSEKDIAGMDIDHQGGWDITGPPYSYKGIV